MIADRWGPIRVIAVSAFVGAIGLALSSQVTTQTEFLLGTGFLTLMGGARLGRKAWRTQTPCA